MSGSGGTNSVPVDAFSTNVVSGYQTNVKVLTFTNWETVLIMKTNWVNAPLTNVVEIELPTPGRTTPLAPAQVIPPSGRPIGNPAGHKYRGLLAANGV